MFKRLELLKKYYNVAKILSQAPNRIEWYESKDSVNSKSALICGGHIEIYDHYGFMVDRISL